eukprot:TRINITY_DN19312_c0_g1_i1.p1 TRINITY_DN19312_c0_g1~~TRINITY_DN19312_c0_g1_i1.p1  ORF type:complete len:367 (+),score=120.14 TRINITY_DN19312_c0_g1_i1:59-1159(+)
MRPVDVLRVLPRHAAVRRWCGRTAADERREAKATAKRREMLRSRDAKNATPTMKVGMKIAQRQDGAKAAKSTLGVIREVGFKNWWTVVWLGNRSRGGGLKNVVTNAFRVIVFFGVLVYPIWFFFYDDGYSALQTRLATIAEFRGIKDARVLDVGVGNGELTRMLALELRDSGSTIHGIDLDTLNVNNLNEQFRRNRIPNVEFEAVDVLHLPKKHADRSYTHVLLSMCLHELDPIRRVSILETAANLAAGGQIVVMDFTAEAAGGMTCGIAELNFSQFRNNVFESLSGHYEYFKSWTATGGLEPLVDAINEQREQGKLSLPPLEVTKVVEEDRGTHAVYIITVGSKDGVGPAESTKQGFLSRWFSWA